MLHRRVFEGALTCGQPPYDPLRNFAMAVERFFRSFLLLQLLAFAKLLFFAVPCRRRAQGVNHKIKHCRRVLQGSPLLLVLAFVIPLAHAANNDQHELWQRALNVEQVGLLSNVVNRPSPAHRLATDVPLHEVHNISVRGPPMPMSRSHRQGWRFPVVRLQYQKTMQWTAVWSDAAHSVDDLFEAADGALDDDEPELFVLEVYPQPHMDSAIFLVTLPWAQTLGRIPVCLQVHRRGRAPLVSMEYVDPMVYCHDLQLLVPECYRAGILFYVGDRYAPLGEFTPLNAVPGVLIRAFPPGVEPRRQETMEQKLLNAWNCFRDVDIEGPPEVHEPLPQVCALALAELPVSVQAAGPRGALSSSQAAEVVASTPEDAVVIYPQNQSGDVALNGFPMTSVVGVLPRPPMSNIIVFVDPRRVAQHVRIAAFPPVAVTAREFLLRANVCVPAAYEATLYGIPEDRWHGCRFLPAPGAWIVVDVRVADDDTEHSHAAPLSMEAGNGDLGPPPSVTRHGRSRSRSNHTRAPAGATNAFAGLRTVCSQDRDMWNQGILGTKVLCSRPPEDTSALHMWDARFPLQHLIHTKFRLPASCADMQPPTAGQRLCIALPIPATRAALASFDGLGAERVAHLCDASGDGHGVLTEGGLDRPAAECCQPVLGWHLPLIRGRPNYEAPPARLTDSSSSDSLCWTCALQLIDDTWNWGAPDKTVRHAHPSGDTSIVHADCDLLAGTRLGESIRNCVWQLDCDLQCALAQFLTVPSVEEDLDLDPLPALLPVDAEALQGTLPGSPDTEVGEWPVLVCVLRYQRPAQFVHLWVAAGETVADFMQRAAIILPPPGPAVDVRIVDPSPVTGALVCTICPAWWNDAERNICVLQWPETLASIFAEVVHVGMSLADLVADLPLEAGRALDFFVSDGSLPHALHMPYQPQNGTLIAINCNGRDGPAWLSAQHMLSDPGMEFARTGIPPQSSSTEDTWLVLAPCAQQRILCRNHESIPDQLAVLCDIPVADLQIYYCHGCLENVAIRGTPVGKVLAVRNKRFNSHEPPGRRLFIDPRELGLPICFLPFRRLDIECADVAYALDFSVPSGMCLRMSREGLYGRCLTRTIAVAGDALTVWAVQATVPSQLAEVPTGDHVSPDHSDHEPDREGGQAPGPGSGLSPSRSRSPRGSRLHSASNTAGNGTGPGTVCDLQLRHDSLAGVDAQATMCAFQAAAAVGRRPVPTPCRMRGPVHPGMPWTPSGPSHAPSSLPVCTAPVTTNTCSRADAAGSLDEAFAEVALHTDYTVLDLARTTTAVANAWRAMLILYESKPQTICLASAVGPRTFALDTLSIPIPGSVDAIFRLHEPWRDFQVLHDVSCLQLHPHTSAALSLCDPVPTVASSAGRCQLYVDGSAKSGLAAWAVVVVWQDPLCGRTSLEGVFGAKLATNCDESHFLEETQTESVHAEQTALAFALLWLLQRNGHPCQPAHYEIFYDNTSAGGGASGASALPKDSVLSQLVRGLAHLADVTVACSVSFVHVYAHEGHAWNELADITAKSVLGLVPAPADCVPAPPSAVAHLARQVNWDWAWLCVPSTANHAFPHVAGGLMSWHTRFDAVQLHPSALLPMRGDQAQGLLQQHELELRVYSLNVQSLKDKHRFIEDQAEAHGCSVLMMQETKTSDVFCESASYIRFAGEAEQYWGTAIWIRKWQRFNGAWIKLCSTDTHLLVAKPRLLAVLLRVSALTVLLLSVHLPQQGRDPREREAVLHDVALLLQRFPDVSLVVMGIDANARLPTDVEHVTGGIPFGQPDAYGHAFAAFLDQHKLYVPSTYEDIHTGQSHTWKHPSGGLARIDFICVRSTVTLSAEQSWMCETLDHLVQQEDHDAVVWQATVTKAKTPDGLGQLDRRQYDRKKMLSDEGKQLLQEALRDYVPPPWNMHPTDHAAHIQAYLQPLLQHHFAKPARGPRAQFISDEVWASRERCSLLRKHTRRWNEGHKPFLQLHVLDRWRSGLCRFEPHVRKHILLRELFATALKFATHWARVRIRRDKQAFLRQFAQGLEGAAAPDVQRALKARGVGGKAAKKTQRHAPCLSDPSTGAPIVGPQAMDDAWLTFFNDMEAGSILDVDDYCRRAASASTPELCCPDAHVLPTLSEIETAFREVPSMKAHGLDNVPPELFNAVPSMAAKLYCPLYVKAALACQQPLQWKGGILFECFKGKGSAAEMANFRSLFISSLPAKAMHRIMRSRLRAAVEDTMHELHCGVCKGRPVVLPTHVLRLALRQLKVSKHSGAVLFLDTATAYYAVIRDLVLGDVSSDGVVMQLFQRFGLSGVDMSELLSLVQAGGVLSQAGVSEHLLHILKDIYVNTWSVTRFSQGDKVSCSRVGSRPGSVFADLVFAFIYHRILGRIRCSAQELGLQVIIPHNGARTLWAAPDGICHEQAHLLDTTWADDSAFITADPVPGRLLAKARLLTQTVLRECRAHGLKPNLKRGKSALMLSLRGAGCRRAAALWFPNDRRILDVPREDGGADEVHIVSSYVHLGTLIDRDGRLGAEANRRIGMMGSAFEQVRGTVLQNPGLDMQTRSQIFSGAVGSVAFNFELWTEADEGWDNFQAGYWRFQRRLLARVYCNDQLFRLQEYEVLYLTRQYSAAITARMKRLGFLTCLVKLSSEIVWAAMQWEKAWTRQLVCDLQWLRQWHDAYEWPPVSAPAWPLWWRLLGRSQWFKRQVRKAAETDWKVMCHSAAEACFLQEIFLIRFPNRRQLSTAPKGFCCPPCQKAFQTKSGLGAHFKKIHGRMATYRSFAGGTKCRACGKEFFAEHRLLMHLKTAVRCRGVILAEGLRSAVPMGAVRNWRRARAETAVLCPPQRTNDGLCTQPVDDVLWEEVPDLQALFQESLDWLVWFDGSCADDARDGLLKFFSARTLYDHEFRRVAAKLYQAAHDLLYQDELRVWTEAGAASILDMLRELAENFRSTIFLPVDFTDDVADRLDVRHICAKATWQATAPRSTPLPQASAALLICTDRELRPSPDVVVLCPIDAIREWHSQRWARFKSVSFRFAEPVDPVGFFGCRLCAQHVADPQQVTMMVLRCLAEFYWTGGDVRVITHGSFWDLRVAFAFCGTPILSHLN